MYQLNKIKLFYPLFQLTWGVFYDLDEELDVGDQGAESSKEEGNEEENTENSTTGDLREEHGEPEKG